MPGLPGSCRLFPVVSGPRAGSVLTPARHPVTIHAVVGRVDAVADARQVQGGYTPGTTEVHRSYAGLGVPVLQIPCPAGPQRFQCSACPAPDLRAEAFFGLALVAELEGAQFAVDTP
jgi:hypothetical protein